MTMKWILLLTVAALAWADDGELLKAVESQDIATEHHISHEELGLPVSLPLPFSRPGVQLPSLHAVQKQGPHGPIVGPQPVYTGTLNLNAAPSHVIENAVEYGPPELVGQPGPVAQPPPGHQPPPPQGHQQPQPQLQGQASTSVVSANGQGPAWPLPTPDTPKIMHMDVKCEKNLMKVAIEFDKPFNGVIFSKGHYSQGNCVHLPAGTGKGSVYFDISINSCGTTGNTQNGLYGYGAQSGSGTFFENTIVIQYDPQVQEVWDQARKLRCTWHDQYEKSVTFRPFPVDMLDVVRADFAGDNVGCWMQIQVGKGPWASEVAGIVKIGQTMTIVLAIKDEENKFDMLVRNCIAHDGKRAPIELVDSQGCIVRPKLMSKFTKIKNFGSSASVLSYAHFQAFKFPDSMEVHFQCTIQICRYQCPEQCSSQPSQPAIGGPGVPEQPQGQPGDHFIQASNIYHTVVKPREERRKRRNVRADDIRYEVNEIGMNKVLQVVSTGDLAFAVDQQLADGQEQLEELSAQAQIESGAGDLICMSTFSFTSASIVLVALLMVSFMVAFFACWRSSHHHRSLAAGHQCRAPMAAAAAAAGPVIGAFEPSKAYGRSMMMGLN